MALFGHGPRRRRHADRPAPEDPSSSEIPGGPQFALSDGDDAFPSHVFTSLDAEPIRLVELIGDAVRVVEKRPHNGPLTMMTSGVSRLPTDSGHRIELAVEVTDGQQGAARIALEIVCDDIAQNRRVPPLETPWRNNEPFLHDTRISAIMATSSRWGRSFDEVRSAGGTLLGHVYTLRLLTDAEASFATANGWDALMEEAGSIDALLDVTRTGTVPAADLAGNAPAFVSKLHADHPPRWVTFTGTGLQSVTGLESAAYMDDAGNHEVWSVDTFLARFPWIAGFAREARAGETALFTGRSGTYTLERE